MKRILLNIAMFVGSVSVGFAQFTFTTTSSSYSGNGQPGSGDGAFYSYQPGYGAGNYVDNTCTTPYNSTPSSPDQLGGFDPNVYDATTVTPARPGTIFYGGAIRNMYSGTPCTGYTPSFGWTFNNGRTVDLSLTANQQVQFTYYNNTGTNLDVVMNLYDKPSYIGKLSGHAYTFLADGTAHTITIDFSGDVLVGADMTNIAQVGFTYPFDVKSPDFGLSFADINLGSSVTSSTNEAALNITSSKLYPNPANETAKVELNLKSASSIKVTLADLMGKEVMTIAEGIYTEMNKEFSVANLNKGIYTVNYFVNGASAKSEMLMVK